MGKIDDALKQPQLDTLRKKCSNPDAVQILSRGIPALDDRTATYIDAIRSAFYDGTEIRPKDRERSLIAILSSRDAGLDLAIHVYLGLMRGLSPGEIADIIFLGGIYTGVDRMSDGLAAEMEKRFTVLAQVATPPGNCKVADVMKALHDAFTAPLPPSP